MKRPLSTRPTTPNEDATTKMDLQSELNEETRDLMNFISRLKATALAAKLSSNNSKPNCK
jgi:hypothetical protein